MYVFNHIRCLSLFVNHTATTEIYTLSLHDALPISAHSTDRQRSRRRYRLRKPWRRRPPTFRQLSGPPLKPRYRSEEHTSELQSHSDLVCRLLLEKKKSKMRSHKG